VLRVVLDVNVLVSALLSPAGTPARLLRAWRMARFELVVSPALLAELTRTLAYPKLASRVAPDRAAAFVAWLAGDALLVADPETPAPIASPDPGDAYLLALAASQRAMLVTGDAALADLGRTFPVRTPATLLAMLGEDDA
jgi:uncharacterized protein